MHDLCARALLGEDPYKFEYQGMGTEELDSVVLYCETIEKDRRPGDRLFVETKLDLELVYPGCFGTADAVLYSPAESLLRIYDFKYGRGVHVSAEDNSQLLYYALGAAISLRVPFAEFENVIVQPRCRSKGGAVRRQRRSAVVLLDFWQRVREAAERASASDAPLAAGRHCYFCPGKDICPEQRKLNNEKAREAFDDL